MNASRVPDLGARQLNHMVKRLGRDAGFDLVRVTSAADLPQERGRYRRWLQDGRNGEMSWMTHERASRSASPSAMLNGARAVICAGLAYYRHRDEVLAGTGLVARFAWGRDYHKVLGEKLASLANALAGDLGGTYRWFVDTGPAMDKAFAARSGLGWYGKNTNVLTVPFGSWVLLGEIVTDLNIEPDPPLHRDCGACSLCTVACPTGALGPDYEIDARRCISYLTIEHRGPIPRELRAAIGAWVFGCDICQEVCPPSMLPHLIAGEERRVWARQVRGVVRESDGTSSSVVIRATPGVAPEPPSEGIDVGHGRSTEAHDRRHLDLLWLLRLSHPEYVEAFRGTTIRRAKVWMLRRNAAVALGNVGTAHDIPHVETSLRNDEHPVVRGHAAWALGRLCERHASQEVEHILRRALQAERDDSVRQEIRAARAGPQSARR